MSAQGELERSLPQQRRRQTVIKFTRILCEDSHGAAAGAVACGGGGGGARAVRVRRVAALDDAAAPPSTRSVKRLERCCRPPHPHPHAHPSAATRKSAERRRRREAGVGVVAVAVGTVERLPPPRDTGGNITMSAIIEPMKKHGNKHVKVDRTDKKLNRTDEKRREEDMKSARSPKPRAQLPRSTPARCQSFSNVQPKVDTSLSKRNVRTKVSEEFSKIPEVESPCAVTVTSVSLASLALADSVSAAPVTLVASISTASVPIASITSAGPASATFVTPAAPASAASVAPAVPAALAAPTPAISAPAASVILTAHAPAGSVILAASALTDSAPAPGASVPLSAPAPAAAITLSGSAPVASITPTAVTPADAAIVPSITLATPAAVASVPPAVAETAPSPPAAAVCDALTQCHLTESAPKTADVGTDTSEREEIDSLRAPRLALRRSAPRSPPPHRVPACPFGLLGALRPPPAPALAPPSPADSADEGGTLSRQFRKELNFVESFVESLRYLERSCAAEGVALTPPDSPAPAADDTLRLLNVLIRDERRRANHSLFVLKMREEALKEFTKSQVVWLESRKEGGDGATLKKKQRAALVRLQRECGEMRRVRRALLAAAERRRADLRRARASLLASPAALPAAALPAATLPAATVPTATLPAGAVLAAADAAAPTATTHVDGAYLNVVLRGLALPAMFSGGKQYEVDGSALRDLVETAAARAPACPAPAAARSLLDEYQEREPPPAPPVASPIASSATSPISSSAAPLAAPLSAPLAAPLSAPLAAPLSAPLAAPLAETLAAPLAAPLASPPVARIAPGGVAVGAGEAVAAQAREAEELRRKQRAVELEILALERQQALVVVREVPDKPPPPYTPPAAAPAPSPAAPAAPAAAYPAAAHRERVLRYVRDYCAAGAPPPPPPPAGSLDELLRELCREAVAAAGARDAEGLRRRVLADVSAALGAGPAARGDGGPARRADHVERALLAEWRRREAEWSALEADERAVKEQLCADILHALLPAELDDYLRPRRRHALAT